MKNARIPLSTYRLQFNRDFTFKQATEIVPYLAALGITHCYASPYLRSRPGSTHGYDIIDHNTLNPEIGTQEDFEEYVAALHEHGMGQILDIVPNHMGVMGSDNAWWLDVLENGQASDYAGFFDIDWDPLKEELHGKLLVPILGEQYGTVLDNGELKLTFDPTKGQFSIQYHDHRFPVNPREYSRILNRGSEKLEQALTAKREDFLELQSLIAAFTHLPHRSDPSPDHRQERIRDKEIHKRRLAALCGRSPEIAEFLQQNVHEMNGISGNSKSFDELHELIKVQAYRLAYWRVAADDINYRRFFDINDLAGLRMENELVFEVTHRFVLDLLRQGKIDGLRIDHPDGLYDPAQYFQRLRTGLGTREPDSKRFYVVIEKILSGDEKLLKEWPVDGTTGYDFLNLVNGLFVDPDSLGRMDRIYRAFIGIRVSFDSLVYRSKKIVMHAALASELNVLANALGRIALANRHTCDFTLNSLRDALSKIVACFPVYRTYIAGMPVSPTDRKYIREAVACAKRQSAGSDTSVFDFVEDALLLSKADSQGKIYCNAVIRFAMKAQQFTSAVMAKGLEDTSFYRYHRLASLNEVGGDPRRFGISVEEFHSNMLERAHSWPHSMLETSSHDTKRSEDVRARINVLSEMPAQWAKAVRQWRELNQDKKQLVDDVPAPSRNDEYFLYQTLVGAWPLQGEVKADSSFQERIKNYMLKAVREAKEKSSWANPNTRYESAVTNFVDDLLTGQKDDGKFVKSFTSFNHQIVQAGLLNSMSQTLLKLTGPGLPDLYQGTELWDFSLVDPDNRRPVDYSSRTEMLKELQRWPDYGGLCDDLSDPRLKLFLTWKTLNLRKQYCDLFSEGEYIPRSVLGPKAKHLLAFSRRLDNQEVVVVVARLWGQLLGNAKFPLALEGWKDTRIEAGREGAYVNAFSGERIDVVGSNHPAYFQASQLFGSFPVALLVAV
jgi:(1->4)-alpha-D-glucan 1-alpha-D-glucosylmutase